MHDIQMKMVGPNRFCPDCRRILLTIEDDTFEVADKALILSHGQLDYDPFDPPEVIEVVPEAYCLRRLCRLKRWRRGEKIPRSPLGDDLLKALEQNARASYVLAAAVSLLALSALAWVLFTD